MWKKLFSIVLCVCLLTSAAQAIGPAFSDLTYESYTYSAEDEPLLVPAPYTDIRVITGADLQLNAFSELSDIVYDGNGQIYMSDTGNNRIIITDAAFSKATVLQNFDNDGISDSFNRPVGICINDTTLYVADSENARILSFDRKTLLLKKEFLQPEITVLGDSYQYKPLKIGVTAANHLFVIAEGVNQGLVELDENGNFATFLGAPSVVPNFFDLIWRKFATKEQLAQLEKYVPTEYDALSVDDDGFVYAVSKNSENRLFAKLNHQGSNVSDVDVDEIGDTRYADGQRPYLVDVVENENIFYLLDSKQGKIYVHSDEVGQLFTFGSNATQKGCFYTASAIELVNDQLYVLDGNKNSITVFEPTSFGKNVIEAVKLQKQGKYSEANEYWEKISVQCAHYPLSESGRAEAEIEAGNYQAAMARAKSIRDKDTYEDAFKKQRDEIVRNYFIFIFIIAAAVILFIIFLPKLLRKIPLFRKIQGSDFYQKYKYSTYTCFHPFDGFWDIKRAGKGNMAVALTILGLFTVLYAVRAQFSGYIVTDTVSSEVNVLFECLTILLPLGFYVVSNWCFTTLMDGEGSLKDVFIATCYALKPYVLLAVPLLLLSQILTAEEAMFYQFLDVICWIWVLALLFFGMITTHDYSLSKGIVTLICTVIGICLILFIGLLFINVIQDVVSFVKDIYREISYRMY
ncbi:MAG: YIP1 family protein, partial [Clostridiales bacterium]|nr:YIP1 family protein [Clostridiales bacterium]